MVLLTSLLILFVAFPWNVVDCQSGAGELVFSKKYLPFNESIERLSELVKNNAGLAKLYSIGKSKLSPAFPLDRLHAWRSERARRNTLLENYEDNLSRVTLSRDAAATVNESDDSNSMLICREFFRSLSHESVHQEKKRDELEQRRTEAVIWKKKPWRWKRESQLTRNNLFRATVGHSMTLRESKETSIIVLYRTDLAKQ